MGRGNRRKNQRIIRGGGIFLFLGFLFWLIPVIELDVPYSKVLLDREGRLLSAVISADEQWRFPPTKERHEKFEAAILRMEDKRFYSHIGVDPIALGRAIWLNIRHGRIKSGASTITMQVVRISQKNPPRTIWEKCKEMFLALRLESAQSKEEILNRYIHNAPFGGNTVGIEAATWRYFGRSPSDLSWAEAAMLAVLPNNPSAIHISRNRDQLRQKRDRLLKTLHNSGHFSASDLELALLEPLPGPPKALPRNTPHLLDRMRAEEGRTITTIDLALQRQVHRRILQHHERLSGNQIHNIAAIIIDVESGEVLSYFGNIPASNNTQHSNHVDIIRAPRSTGSILKPLLYAAMLETGELLPKEIIPDIPTSIGGFSPKNYDRTFVGALPASEALARSRNVPAVWMLRKYGVERFYGRLKNWGMSTLSRPYSEYGLALILGGSEGSLWELSTIYRNLAWSLNHATRPKDKMTTVHWKQGHSNVSENDTFDPAAAWFTMEALLEVYRPREHQNWRFFQNSRKVAWKTGTSYGFRDAWAIGMTPDTVIGVWVGNASGEGRAELTGQKAAAPILFDLFGLVPGSEWFNKPMEGIAVIEICPDSGMLASINCPDAELAEIPLRGSESLPCHYCQRFHCDSGCTHRLHAQCASIDQMQMQKRFVLPPSMEYYYTRKHSHYRKLPPWNDNCMETESDNKPMSVIFPRNNADIYLPVEIDGNLGKIVFQATHRSLKKTIHWHLNDEYMGSTTRMHQLALSPKSGSHRLTLVDEDGNIIVRRFQIQTKEQ